jgi:hypothetical protein
MITKTTLRKKYNSDYSLPDFYKYYLSTLDKYELESSYNLSKKDYSKYLSELNERAMETAIHGNVVRFPARMGDLLIKKSLKKARLNPDGTLDKTSVAIDYGSTNKLWKSDEEAKANKTLVFHSNEHSDKYIFKWVWDKTIANFKNKSGYKFIAVRKAKRSLAKEVKKSTNKSDYYEFANR